MASSSGNRKMRQPFQDYGVTCKTIQRLKYRHHLLMCESHLGKGTMIQDINKTSIVHKDAIYYMITDNSLDNQSIVLRKVYSSRIFFEKSDLGNQLP